MVSRPTHPSGAIRPSAAIHPVIETVRRGQSVGNCNAVGSNSGQLDFDCRAVLSDWKNRLKRLAAGRLGSGFQFVLPSMPRTRHAAVRDMTFGERSALVRADSVHRVPLARMKDHGENSITHQGFSYKRFCVGIGSQAFGESRFGLVQIKRDVPRKVFSRLAVVILLGEFVGIQISRRFRIGI